MKRRPGPKPKPKTIEDILKKTERVGECRIWVGAKHVQGYGMVRQAGVMRSVHSVVAELKYGYTPDKYHGERVTRSCDNVACVNPDHVIIVKANTIKRAKSIVKGRFSDQEIRDIRKEYDSEEVKYGLLKNLSERYNCSVPLMSGVCHRRIYKRVKDET